MELGEALAVLPARTRTVREVRVEVPTVPVPVRIQWKSALGELWAVLGLNGARVERIPSAEFHRYRTYRDLPA